MKNSKAWLALLIPVVVLGLWALRLQIRGRSGVEIELPVTGYDPRDPISGHYLTYRLAMGLHDPCRPSGPLIARDEQRCLCFDASENPQPNWAGACEQKPASCSLYIKGNCEWSGFIVGVERYYFPEQDVPWLVLVPPKSSVILSVGDSGHAQLKEFRPEGQPYDEWIDRQKKEKPKP